LPRETVVSSQRERLLRAMSECCAERGYAATTVLGVVDRAGVSSATFYQLFRDKEDCFLAAGQAILARTMTVVSEAYAGKEDETEALRDGIAAILEFMAAHGDYARLTFIESRTSTPRARELYLSGMRSLVSIMERGLRGGNGEAPASAARAALGGAEAIVQREIVAGRAESLPALLPELLYCALVPFRGREEAERQAELAREHAGQGEPA
jgi:AcrR family transcriptional regulator